MVENTNVINEAEQQIVQLPQNLDELAEVLFGFLSDDGQYKTNKSVREELTQNGFTWGKSDRYWEVRDRLIDQGRAKRAVGHGGRVARVIPEKNDRADQSEPVIESQPQPISIPLENTYYEPIGEVLRGVWAKDHSIDNPMVEITADRGKRAGGGMWSKPDITLIFHSTFRYIPGKTFDLWTFEIKREMNITAVYEANAHARFATKAYAMFPVPKFAENTSEFDRIYEECKRLNVGLILFENADDYDTWRIEYEPARKLPDLSLMDDFIAKNLSQPTKDQLGRWK